MQAELTGSTFARPEEFDLARYWQAWRDDFEARQERHVVALRVPPTSGPLLALVFGEGIVAQLMAAPEEHAAGHVRLSLTFDSLETACRQLLGLGTAVEVLDPLPLRELMQQQARIALDLYS